jgi:N6-adenosine-specific RNA methylase IME4
MNELSVIDSYCKLDKTSLSFKRDVSREEWQKVFNSLNHIEGCVQFWIGDCLKYREQKWGMYEDIAETSGIDKGTLKNYVSVSKAIESSCRHDDLTFTHHQQVASLSKKQQMAMLDKAVENAWSVRELRGAVKSIKHSDLKQPEMPDKKYGVIYADPPWEYQAVQQFDGKITSAATDHYPTMSIEKLCALPIQEMAKEDCVLFMWTTSPLLEKSFPVINAWGFSYRASFVWDKIKHNVGHYNSVRHEFLLIAIRGKGTPENVKLFDSVQSIERSGKHSEKPSAFREIIETLYPDRKKIELFARTKIKGWDVWGNQA